MAKSKKPKPANSRAEAIINLVEGRGIGDEYLEIHGPSKIAELVVWQVWVKNKYDGTDIRLVEEVAGAEPLVYDSFQEIAIRLDSLHEDLRKRAQADEWTRTKEMIELQAKSAAQEAKAAADRLRSLITLAVASGGFVIAILAIVYLAVYGGSAAAWASAFVLCSVVASACIYFYGKFEKIKLPFMRGESTGS